MASDPPETDQAVRHGPNDQVQHTHPDPAVLVDHTVAGCRRSNDTPPSGTTNKRSTSCTMPLMAPGSATGHQTLVTTAGCELMSTPVAR